MKKQLKYTLLLSLLIIFSGQTIFGQQSKTTAPEVQANATIQQLQAENEAIKKQMESLEKEVAIYREDVRNKENTINDNLSHWLTILAIVIGALGVGLGVLAPIVLNLRNDKKQQEKLNKLEGQLNTVQQEANSAKEDAKSAKDSLLEINRLKGSVEAIKKDIDQSKEAAEKAAKMSKASENFTQALSEEDKLKAFSLYTKAIELNPDFSEAYNNRGILKRKSGDKEGAMKDYDMAIEKNLNNSSAYYNRGNLKNDLGDKEGAMKDFDMAIKKNLNFSEAYNNRGNLKRNSGDKEGAMKDYDMAIEKNPNNSKAYNNRGILKKNFLSDIDGAIKDFSSTISIDNKKAKAYVNRAKCYRILAEQNPDEQAQWIAKAEADEEKAASLKKKD